MKFNAKSIALFCVFASLATAAQAAANVYIRFKPYNAAYLTPVALSGMQAENWTPVSSFSSNIEQTLNIGSQSSGAGAGKVTFNPFTVTLPSSTLDAKLFTMCCQGTPFSDVEVAYTTPGSSGNTITEIFHFKLVAVKTVSWSITGFEPTSQYTFEFGGLVLEFPQFPGGPKTVVIGGWDRVKNTSLTDPKAVLGGG
jgi:type VI protein secretion system component Hcp